MRIAFLSHLDINLYLFRLSLMKELMRSGEELYAIVPEGDYSDSIADEGIKVIHYNINRASLNPLNALRSVYDIVAILRREKIDVLHSFTFKPNVFGAFSGRIAGTPVIINHITGLGFVYTEHSLKARMMRILSNTLYRVAFSIASMVIFQNNDDLKVLGRYVHPRKRTVIVSSGVDIEKFSHEKVSENMKRSLRKSLNIKNDQVVVTLIARLNRHKGVYEYIEAAKEVIQCNDTATFLVVGWIDEGNPAALTGEYQKSVECDRVKFLGRRDDIVEILSITDIFVLPSYREGTPNTVLEAMAMSRPVITTDVPGCRETVIPEESGILVPSGEYKPLVGGLLRLIADREMRETMGAAARKRAEETFSDKIINRKTLSVYKNLFEQKGFTTMIGKVS